MSLSSSGLRRSQSTRPTRTTTATPASGSQSCQSFRSSFNACLCIRHRESVSYGRIVGTFCCVNKGARPGLRDGRYKVKCKEPALRLRDDGISERADTADADFDDVAGGQRAHARGRAGGDHVAGFQRHHLRDKADYSINGKDHFRRVSRLFPDSIHVGFDGDAGGSELRFEDGAEGAKRVEALAASELHVEFL